MEKHELKRYRKLVQEIEVLEDQLLEVSTQAGKMTTKISDMPRGGEAPRDKLGDQVVKMVEIENLINQKILQCRAEVERIEKAIEKLEPTERCLVRLRYIQGMYWEEICVKLSYGWAQIHRIHDKALIELRSQKQT